MLWLMPLTCTLLATVGPHAMPLPLLGLQPVAEC